MQQRTKEEVIFISALDDLNAIVQDLQLLPPEQQVAAMQTRMLEEAGIYENMRLKAEEGTDYARAFAALRQTLETAATVPPEAYRNAEELVTLVEAGLNAALEEGKPLQDMVEERLRAGGLFTPSNTLDPDGLRTFPPLSGKGWDIN